MALTQVQPGMLASDSQYTGFKNRIINGAMVIDQRNAGASVTPTSATYTLDRWKVGISQSSKFSVQQSTTAPVGFSNSFLATSTSAYTVGASEYFLIQQAIEGFNFSDCGWGTANAKTVTLSFWVRSSLTGTFGGSLFNASLGRSYPYSYTISSANTWEQKSITIAGDTSGTWVGATNDVGVYVSFSLGSGSSVSGTAGSWSSTWYGSATGATSVVGTNGATFYITGVQLEKGSTATSFDYRPYGTELALCQRYYQRQFPVRGGGAGNGGGNGISRVKAPLIVTMRVSPTATAVGTMNTYDGVGGGAFTSLATVWMTPDMLEFDSTFTSGSTTVGRYNSVYNSATPNTGNLPTDGVTLNAEL